MTSSWSAHGAPDRRPPCCWPGAAIGFCSSIAPRSRATPCRPTGSISRAWPTCDAGGNYLTTLEIAGDVAERVRAGRREERFVGTLGLRNFYRKPYGPGWAFVGDAGYHKDPITAQGITDAFRDAESLTAVVDDWMGGRQAWDNAMAGYERGRDEATMPMYEFTCGLAALDPPPPEMAQLFQALVGNQPEIDRFFGPWPEP